MPPPDNIPSIPRNRRCLVVIPAYNEEEALPHTLDSLQSLPEGFEVVVVNDGSRDSTAAVVRQAMPRCRLPLYLVSLSRNSGIGVAVQTGFRFAARRGEYRYVIQFDADGQHDAACLVQLVETCEREQLDLCLGSRFLHPTQATYRSTAMRRVGIRFFSTLISLLTGVRVTDPTSGCRCLGERAWRTFADRYPDDYPEPESLYWAIRNGLKVSEIPVRMFPRAGGTSSIRHVRSLYYMLKVSLAILIDSLRRREEIRC